MKRKIFSMIALLLMVVSGAWAQNPNAVAVSKGEGNQWTLNMPENNVRVTVTYKSRAVLVEGEAAPAAPLGRIAARSNTPLVSAGNLLAEGSQATGFMYLVTEASAAAPTTKAGFTATVPTAETLEAGDYNVYYYIVGDDAHSNSMICETPIAVTLRNMATLAETTNNATWITDNAGKVYDITLTRTLQTGGWNTFAVPFDLDKPSGWTVKQLTETAYDEGTKVLTLTFSDALSIVAGKPYLVKMEASVENPTFSDVEVKTTTVEEGTVACTHASFVPAINPTALPTNDKSYLFVSGGNTLTWANAGSSMNGFRAYFHILDSSIANARAFKLNIDDESTGITTTNITNDTNSVYDLLGRKVNVNVNANVKKGVYVVNGKKTVIK